MKENLKKHNYSLKRFIHLFIHYEFKCKFCNTTEDLEIHHIIPLETLKGRGSYQRLKDLKANNNIILLCHYHHRLLENFIKEL